ncbi:hypothetical protein ABD87_22885 [Lysinibacillus sphaericus]|uniref:hypothetical protein n=1 Tax=Lysinibacillus sphaericus TaxID=1421 RepID=UPI0018CE7B9C|nr:hypothetical protein [Lysinibacillus sphaericus]MBG9732274.1 hypothetical protein [Lysinibacillus sphaericus]
MNFREFFKTSNFTKVAEGDSNWDYYVLQYKDGSRSIVSLAKDNSGASDSCFGDFDYFQRFINSKNSGEIKLTAYGESLFSINESNLLKETEKVLNEKLNELPLEVIETQLKGLTTYFDESPDSKPYIEVFCNRDELMNKYNEVKTALENEKEVYPNYDFTFNRLVVYVEENITFGKLLSVAKLLATYGCTNIKK